MKQLQLNSINLGVEIYHLSHIKKIKNFKVDFIIVEVERMYLNELNFGSNYSIDEFYETLFNTFITIPILIQLPRPETIQRHFLINENPTLNMMSYSRFSHFYLEIFSSIIKHHHSRLSIIIPDVESPDDFNQIKWFVLNYFTYKNYPKIGIGLGIDTLDVFDNHKSYSKFDYTTIEIERMFYERHDNPKDDNERYLKDLIQLKYELKRRGKALIIRGEVMHRFNHFQLLLRNGFKYFVIDENKYEYYKELIKKLKKANE